MSKELTRRAVDMLLKGATLLSDPCPYCKGVRIMKDGNALCISCGKEPKDESMSTPVSDGVEPNTSALVILEKKLEKLSRELEKEHDHEKQQSILKSINLLIESIEKLKNK